VVTAFSPRGEVVGCHIVSNAGNYGTMYIYGADDTVEPPIPGMETGETIRFKVDGWFTDASPILVWSNDHDFHQVDLAGEINQLIHFPFVIRSD
jgi:hypothetical protein